MKKYFCIRESHSGRSTLGCYCLGIRVPTLCTILGATPVYSFWTWLAGFAVIVLLNSEVKFA